MLGNQLLNFISGIEEDQNRLKRTDLPPSPILRRAAVKRRDQEGSAAYTSFKCCIICIHMQASFRSRPRNSSQNRHGIVLHGGMHW